MNWAQFKDSIFHMCPAGAVLSSWSLTQEVAGSSPFTVMTNIFVTEFAEFSETFRKNCNISVFSVFYKQKIAITATIGHNTTKIGIESTLLRRLSNYLPP